MRSVRSFAVFAVLVVAACNRDVDSITAPNTTTTPRPSAAVTNGAPAVPQVIANDLSSCALRVNGAVTCWGYNSYNILTPPAHVFTQISGGYSNACGVTSSGEIKCWGQNAWGQGSPPPAPEGLTYRAVGTGSADACGIRSDGSLACWGKPDGTTTLAPAGSYTGLSVGQYHACAISTVGELACWGTEYMGLLSQKPVAPDGRKFTQVATGAVHSCAVVDDGTITCWGNNQNGQTTVPALTNGLSYTKVSVSRSTAYPSSSFYATCALRSDGTIDCWGSSRVGSAPPLPAGTTYTDLDLGDLHACAVRSDAAVVCWGNLLYGQGDVPPTLNLLKRSQSIVFTPELPASAEFGSTFDFVPNVGPGSPTVLNVTTPTTCWLSETTLGFIGVGTCTLTADRAGNDEYEAAPHREITITVTKIPQRISFLSDVPNPAYPGMSYYFGTNGGASGNDVIVSSLTPNICSVSLNKVSFLAGGDCIVAANQDGNEHYATATQATQTTTVTKLSQTIAFAPVPPSTGTVGTQITLNATASSSKPVTFTAGTPTTCSVASGVMTLTNIGACTVVASQAGDAVYTATQSQITITVRWPFTGFVGVVAEPAVNLVRAGSSVALTFSLGGNRGLNVLAAGSPTVAPYVCGGTLPAPGSGIALPLAKNGALAYSTKTGQYTITYKPEKREQNCRLVSIRLTDGTIHTVRFQLQ